VPFASFATRGHQVVRTLAIGKVATTFEMARASDGGLFVCKRLRPRFVADPEAAEMLTREAAILGRLGGRGAPLLVDSGQDEHGPFVVTGRVDAPTLGSFLPGRAPLPRAPSAGWLEGAARSAFLALAAVHEATDAVGPLAIVHGDLSPGNVLVNSERATILDFALASFRDAPRATGGAFRGTVLYAAPEAARGEHVDPRSDLFALAAALLHVASGEPPRSGSEPSQLLLQAGEASLEAYAARAGAALEPGVARGLARCVAFEPAGRPKSAREVFGTHPA
jgi:serine/threonine protein kinase